MPKRVKQKRNYTLEQREAARLRMIKINEVKRQNGQKNTDSSRNRGTISEGMARIGHIIAPLAQNMAYEPETSQGIHLPSGAGVHEGSSEVCPEQVHPESGSRDQGNIDSAGINPSNRAGDGTGPTEPDTQSNPLAEQLKLLRDPVVFCQSFCFPRPLAPWQRDILQACRIVNDSGTITGQYPKNIALAAVNGSGKTELIASIVRYLLASVPGCMIAITSSVYRQLEMMHRYLSAQSTLLPGWHLVDGKLVAPNGNEARWFCADSPGSVESFHAPFMVRILDEVKSIPDDIIDATNRWHPQLSIYVSSKGNALGEFYRCFTVNSERWRTFEVTADDCPWLNKRFLDNLIEEKGENHPLVTSMVRNEWSDSNTRSLISLNSIQQCMKYPCVWYHSGVVAGIDLSAARKGGDECVIMHRLGNKVMSPFVIRGAQSEMEAVGVAIRYLKEIKARYVFCDNGGMGAPMISRMEEVLRGDKSIEIIRVNFGSEGSMGNKNKAAEIWETMKNKIDRKEIILCDDGKLIGQLTSREFEVTSAGEIKLVSKEIMRKKGLDSPDRADALALCLMEPTSNKPISTLDLNNGDDAVQDKHAYNGKFYLGV